MVCTVSLVSVMMLRLSPDVSRFDLISESCRKNTTHCGFVALSPRNNTLAQFICIEHRNLENALSSTG